MYILQVVQMKRRTVETLSECDYEHEGFSYSLFLLVSSSFFDYMFTVSVGRNLRRGLHVQTTAVIMCTFAIMLSFAIVVVMA